MGGEGLEKDRLFHLLSNYRRIYSLRVLDEHGKMDRGELAEHVAARENGKPREDITGKERKAAYVSLYQMHLPKLVENGLVTEERDTYELGPRADRALEYINPDRGILDRARERVLTVVGAN